MATRTSVGSGLWSAAGTWDTGVPANTDLVVIAAGHTVTFDVDQSAFAAGIGTLTIQSGGTLIASTSAGNYYLKMAGHIQNSGTIQAGTSAAVRYPSNCTFTIYFNGNYQLNNQASHAGKVYFYCYQPVVTYAKLISASPKAITGISKANPCTVTCVGHGKSAGDTVFLVNVGGMVELDDLRVKVNTVLGADSFTIKWYDSGLAVDSTTFTNYTSGGYVCPETAEAVGQTQLEVDTDLSADAEWTRSGAVVNICNANRSYQIETRTIASVAADNVTVTAGLTNTKVSSALVVLLNRNIRLISSGTAISNGVIRYGSACVFDCEITPSSTSSGCIHNTTDSFAGGSYTNGASNNAIFQNTNITIGGVVTNGSTGAINYNLGITTLSGLLAGANWGFYNNNGIILSGLVVGCGNSLSLEKGVTISGVIRSSTTVGISASTITSTGKLSDCTTGLNSGQSNIVNGKIIACLSGISGCSDVAGSGSVIGCSNGALQTMFHDSRLVFFGNTYDLNICSGSSIESLYGSNTEHYQYNGIYFLHKTIMTSFVHDQVAGAFRAWTRGGITSSTATSPPTGRTRSYQTVCESATYPGWYQREIVVDAGRQLRLRVWLKADAGVEIKAQLVLPTADPLITGTGTGEWQQIGTSDGTWYEYVTSWTNSATYPVTIYARVLSTAASGNGYSDMMWAFDRTPLVR